MNIEKVKITNYLNSISRERDKWRWRNSYYHKSLKNIYNFFIPKEEKILEIGCSTGDLLAGLEPLHGIGVDLSPAAIKLAREKYSDNNNLTFIQGDAETFELNEKTNYVILSDTIGYLNDIQTAFENIKNVMTPKSRLIINSYNFVWEPIFRIAQWLGLKQKIPQQNWLSNDDIVNLLELAGYEVVHKEGFILFPKYIPLLSSFLNGFVAKWPLIRGLTIAQFIVARLRYAPPDDDINNYTVSVIVPARNEAGNIEQAITRTPEMGKWTEFIFIEGNSQDNTWEEIQRIKEKYSNKRIKIMQQDGKGKKDAIYKGFAHAEGDVLMILDSDLAVMPEDLPKFYKAIAENKGEYINGVRLVYPIEKKAMRFLNLYANKTFSILFSYILNQPYKDTLCGTKVLWRKDWERIKENLWYFGDFDPYGDFDIIFGAAKLCLKTIQIPVRYRARTYGKIQIDRFSGGWLLLKMACIGFKKFKLNLR